jgi:hypothetical protein
MLKMLAKRQPAAGYSFNGRSVHGSILATQGKDSNYGSHVVYYRKSSTQADAETEVDTRVATPEVEAAMDAVQSWFARQAGRPVEQIRAEGYYISYPGQYPQEKHTDSKHPYLNIIMNAQTTPIHGTEVEGAKKVKLKQYQAQLFFANQPHKQPAPPRVPTPPVVGDVRRNIFMSFSRPKGAEGEPILVQDPPQLS